MIDATDGDGGPGDFIHSDYLALIDPLHHIRGYYKGTEASDIDRLIKDINRLKNEFRL
jgi:protein SCO1/2